MKRRMGFTPLETIGRQRKDRVSLTGFTLVEVLVASVIFSIIIVTIYSAFTTGIFGQRYIDETITTYQSARQVLERINLDLRNSFIYKQSGTEAEAKFIGDEHEIRFMALIDTFSEDTTLHNYALVGYSLTGDKLMRLCRKNVDAIDEGSLVEAEEMAGAFDISFQYGFLPEGGSELQFKTTWAQGKALTEGGTSETDKEKKMLPQAVKVELTVKGKTDTKFMRTIYLPKPQQKDDASQ